MLGEASWASGTPGVQSVTESGFFFCLKTLEVYLSFSFFVSQNSVSELYQRYYKNVKNWKDWWLVVFVWFEFTLQYIIES